MARLAAAEGPPAAPHGAADPYRAPWWLPGGHVQTIAAARLYPCPSVTYRRERWDTPDGDFLDADFAQPEPAAAAAPVLAVFHGLEGHSGSPYCRALMATARAAGWRALVVHFRGCSGEPNRLPRAYHSGDADEIDWVLRRLQARFAASPLYAAGVSLGGNALALWLGQRGRDASFLGAAAVIGAPLDLAAGGAALERGFARVYAEVFLGSLRRKAIDKVARHGLPIAVEQIRRCRSLREFDDLYTAPVHGFRDSADYWHRASALPALGGVAVPTLLLNARNDPIVPAASLPRPAQVAPVVRLVQPDAGGHVGFPGRDLGLDWMPRQVLRFLARG